MLNFPTELDRKGVDRIVKDGAQPERKASRTSASRAYLMRQEWDWSDLRDYVVYEIESRFGAIEREAHKEASIFKGFLGRWGDNARRIAEYAFQIEDGMWQGKPVDIFRFTKGSDHVFAKAIIERIRAAE